MFKKELRSRETTNIVTAGAAARGGLHGSMLLDGQEVCLFYADLGAGEANQTLTCQALPARKAFLSRV